MAPKKTNPKVKTVLWRMYNQGTQTLVIRNLTTSSHLQGMCSMFDNGSCKALVINHSLYPEVVLDILAEAAKSRNKLTDLYVDAWNIDFERFIPLLRECIVAHEESLEALTVKCRMPLYYMTMMFDFIPTTLKTLDLSDNDIAEPAFVSILTEYIRSSDLELVRLINSKLKADLINELVKLILDIENPFPLKKIDGVDFSMCDEIPKCVRQSMTESLKFARKHQMSYKDYSTIDNNEVSSHFMDYVRNVMFMKRMVGMEVRVWWPATKDDNRTSFAGRLWPAKIIMANPVDLVFVVKYDNEDIDHVPCKHVQPKSPFKYGGGLDRNYLYYLTGPGGITSRCVNLRKELDRNISRVRYISTERVQISHHPCKNNGVETETNEVLKTPENTKAMDSAHSNSTKGGSTSFSSRYENEFLCINCGFVNNIDVCMRSEVDLDTVESVLGLEEKYKGNLLVPGEFCEFRDPLDQFRNDPSDYMGVVTKVNESEPLYECVCIYQDNEEVISVHSKDIRRTVVVPWYNWVEMAFKLLLERRKVFEKLKQSSQERTPAKRYQEHSLKTAPSDEPVENGLEEYNILNRNFYYLSPIEIEDLKEYVPPNPLEMKLVTLNRYASLVSSKITSHPRLQGIFRHTTNNQMDPISLKLKSLTEFNEILQMELQNERDKNIELQSKFKCIVCFDTEINCVLDPCTHFSFCYE
ncbi:conserved hypothetical protein [Theileria orientalis strain Shintoku]|uniref:Uncharacterized protein n=1 Tax=Theileria orientalis strain Shintoku TaxID=869250 RepID=J4D6B4_THEOR|nr:conserved hypothetical protein [Theileria orientalis strain Shintoku]BAM39470.1 conserved hypothetical protein [Theileria orientalis strain Shintoku]|eukprot:XP_009689771.1 conserved hypothetical protein [Theileria orientalis strain Shintoku]